MWTYIQENSTKLLAKAIGLLGVLQVSTGVVPVAWGPYLTLVVALLVQLQGEANTQKLASAVVDKHLDIMATQAVALSNANAGVTK